MGYVLLAAAAMTLFGVGGYGCRRVEPGIVPSEAAIRVAGMDRRGGFL